MKARHEGPLQAYRLGQALASLTARGFLLIGSGNLTHNLADFMTVSRSGDQTPEYVRRFSAWVAKPLAQHDLAALLNYRQQAPDAVQAHPTDEYLLPLIVALGTADPNPQVDRFHVGIDHYVISMDAYAFSAIN